jgi:outer membrane cobalamin receptor
MKKILLLLIAIVMTATLHAQLAQFTVLGTVMDSTGKPLSGANVTVTSPVTKKNWGKVTNNQGVYSFKLDTGRYDLKIVHAGYGTVESKIRIKAGDNILQPVKLSMKENLLANVTVSTRRPLVEVSNDKIVYNTEGDPGAKNESASDMFRKIPLLSVDGEGNVQLNGQSNFRVLLNGRETAMFAQNIKDALKGFPGALIARVEVITSPSAKYDAEGIGGLINIITKNKITGYNGFVNISRSHLGVTNGSVSLNAKKGKFTFSGMAFGMAFDRFQHGENRTITTPFTPVNLIERNVFGDRSFRNKAMNANVEIAMEIDSQHTVSIYGNRGRNQNELQVDQTSLTYYKSQASPETGKIFQETETVNPSLSVGMDFIKKFKKKPGKEFSTKLFGVFGESTSDFNSFLGGPGFTRYLQSQSNADNREFTLQTDYAVPVKKSRVEMGAKVILRDASSDNFNFITYDKALAYKQMSSPTDHFEYKQTVTSGYFSLSKNTQKMNYRIGVRGEYTDINGNYQTTAPALKASFFNFVPNIQVTRTFSPAYTLVTGYTIRVNRPFINQLNPFVNTIDTLNISSGNPNLKPQTTHSFMLQNRLKKGKVLAIFGTVANISQDMIMQRAVFDKATGVTRITFDNIGKEFLMAFIANISSPIGKKINVNLNGNVRYNRIQDRTNLSLDKSGITGGMHGNFTYRMFKQFTVSGSGGNMWAPVTLFSQAQSFGFYQLNFGYKLLKDKLTLSFNANNFLSKTREQAFVTENTDFRTVSSNYNPYRMFFIGAMFNFGKLKENTSKKQGVNNDDLL